VVKTDNNDTHCHTSEVMNDDTKKTQKRKTKTETTWEIKVMTT